MNLYNKNSNSNVKVNNNKNEKNKLNFTQPFMRFKPRNDVERLKSYNNSLYIKSSPRSSSINRPNTTRINDNNK